MIAERFPDVGEFVEPPMTAPLPRPAGRWRFLAQATLESVAQDAQSLIAALDIEPHEAAAIDDVLQRLVSQTWRAARQLQAMRALADCKGES